MAEYALGSAWAVLAERAVNAGGQIDLVQCGALLDGTPIFAGREFNGDLHLLVPIADSERFSAIGERRALQLRRVETASGVFASALCTDRNLDRTFLQFANELIETLSASASPGADLRKAYQKWRALFADGANAGLDRMRELGLLAEMHMLRAILREGGRCGAWRGWNLEAHDFQNARSRIEVKATAAREGLRVTIHGVDQLDCPPEESLSLVIFRFEARDGGESLVDVIRQLESEIDDAVLFASQLRRSGFDWAHADDYATSYAIVEMIGYHVNPDFPRIVRSSFVEGDQPRGTMQLSYVLDLTGEPPARLTEDELRALTREIAVG